MRLAAAVIGAAGLGAASIPASAATPEQLYEWGRPVASGGPGVAPTAVQRLGDVVALHAGNNSDMALLGNGTVWAWGQTELGKASMTAVQVPGLKNVFQDPVAGNHDFAALEQPGDDPSCPRRRRS